MSRMIVALLASLVAVPAAAAPMCSTPEKIELEHPNWSKDERKRRSELSGVVVRNGDLLMVSNEAINKTKRQHAVQIYSNVGASKWRFKPGNDRLIFDAPATGCGDSDFEALAIHNDRLMAITSHSLSRRKQKDAVSNAKRHAFLGTKGIKTCDTREQLKEFSVGADHALTEKSSASLMPYLKKAEGTFSRFLSIPGKENGVDIEGLAVNKNGLFIGFRGPVLRGNLVPVVRVMHSPKIDVETAAVFFANFNGHGIRGMTSKSDVIYFLTGPNGDEGQDFAIHRWDGKGAIGDQSTNPVFHTELMCSGLKRTKKGKPEAIAILSQEMDGDIVRSTRFLIVYDGKKPKAGVLKVEE